MFESKPLAPPIWLYILVAGLSGLACILIVPADQSATGRIWFPVTASALICFAGIWSRKNSWSMVAAVLIGLITGYFLSIVSLLFVSAVQGTLVPTFTRGYWLGYFIYPFYILSPMIGVFVFTFPKLFQRR